MSNDHPLYPLVPPELKATCDPYCATFWSSQAGNSSCSSCPLRPSCGAVDASYDPCSDPLSDPFPAEKIPGAYQPRPTPARGKCPCQG